MASAERPATSGIRTSGISRVTSLVRATSIARWRAAATVPFRPPSRLLRTRPRRATTASRRGTRQMIHSPTRLPTRGAAAMRPRYRDLDDQLHAAHVFEVGERERHVGATCQLVHLDRASVVDPAALKPPDRPARSARRHAGVLDRAAQGEHRPPRQSLRGLLADGGDCREQRRAARLPIRHVGHRVGDSCSERRARLLATENVADLGDVLFRVSPVTARQADRVGKSVPSFPLAQRADAHARAFGDVANRAQSV